MSVLWSIGEGTVNDVRERLDADLAYTSISTIIRLLELKGFVGHRKGTGKTHRYFPRVKADTVGRSAIARVLDKIYGGSPVQLMTHLVERQRLSETELTRMRELLRRSARRK